jgi:hypothetical protein
MVSMTCVINGFPFSATTALSWPNLVENPPASTTAVRSMAAPWLTWLAWKIKLLRCSLVDAFVYGATKEIETKKEKGF